MSSWYPSRIDPHVGNFVQRFATLLANDYQVSVIHTVADKNCSTINVSDTTIAGVRTVLIYYPKAIKNWTLVATAKSIGNRFAPCRGCGFGFRTRFIATGFAVYRS
jgi:hypothetical protein